VFFTVIALGAEARGEAPSNVELKPTALASDAAGSLCSHAAMFWIAAA